ncbi:DUF167 domain-containing protein [Patescibacteria group bacterium]|nr:DUF167 domain-containing protein [Patescibacteria group bacterium]MBU1755363.1 DUF167 domain-containing protein [Patescibacteria group bacterium]
MKILVKVRPKAKKNSVERVTEPTLTFAFMQPDLPVYKVSTTEPPTDNRANMAIIELLADHFDISKSDVTLISGHTSKQKVFSIDS